MSIPPDSPWRGCAAAFPQPVDESLARSSVEILSRYNRGIVYRSSDREQDIVHHVFRWNTTHYGDIFERGFQAWPQGDTPAATYYNLEHHVFQGGIPLDQDRPVPHFFVSTTLNGAWRPNLSTRTVQEGQETQVYRYEIYAPGGIWVRQTLGDQYVQRGYDRQDEVAFAGGIARQYIRAVQVFTATRAADSRFINWRRTNTYIIINGHYNPQSHPFSLIRIQRPAFDYLAADNRRMPLTIRIWRPELPQVEREKRNASDDDIAAWYASDELADSAGYINAAFCSSRTNEAYLFMKNEYVLLNYAPGTTNDRIVNGPILICAGYPSLSGTAFGEYGIDCAFNSHHGNRAFIFSGNLCAHIDYAPGTTDDRILNGPMTITAMFPFFNGTVFASSIDAAFTATATNKAYLFKGDSYALINYDSKACIAIRKITEGFYSLRNTIFQSGVEAAFASHRRDEAYIFKGDQYALINFAPGSTNDYIIGGVKGITANWPSLRRILPRNNRGLEEHDHHNPRDEHYPEHDEI